MLPVKFEGAQNISKPENMTDEQCMSIWAKFGFDVLYKIIELNGIMKLPEGIYAEIDGDGYPFYLTAWRPNKEDLDAFNRGEPVYVKTLSKQLPPMSLFTIDEKGNPNY